MSISENIALIQEQMAAAANRANRKPEEIALMAVSKTFSPAAVREAYAAGLRIFGESRIQEFSSKILTLHDLPDAKWHMIGHLQSNKALKAAELFQSVDSLDSLRLARRLNDSARQLQKTIEVLIEINIGGEEAKTGIAPDAQGLEEILQAAQELDHLQISGLMTVPPYADDPEQARPYFRRLRGLQQNIARRNLPGVSMRVLSMGMSHDFEIAIEEGSTCVRVGTAIFGDRTKI